MPLVPILTLASNALCLMSHQRNSRVSVCFQARVLITFYWYHCKFHCIFCIGLPGVQWVLLDSYIDVKNKDYGGDKYVKGEIIPCKYRTYQPKQRNSSKYESRRYDRWRDGPPSDRRKPKP
ncbi:uncharacterized protein A4U43_C03F9180 [Asparagus officinalis]|uniref:Uncharacterized protein n=1 Tax=Asparagus officinalis TaxID=4686 RepID=A0A5P1F9C1_ASPOF|nr:uncharacterized protein A4U43_C03F9180 [Asparagus officinalis]